MQPQPGIFALGISEHCYLDLDLDPGGDAVGLVTALAELSGPETSAAGLSVVIGFRPELWASVAPGEAPADARSFQAVEGPELRMPATQHDAWVWIGGGTRAAVFDSARRTIRRLQGLATVVGETTGWIYHHDRDLTGFIDGTENPSVLEALEVAAVKSGSGVGSSVVLVQHWRHLPSFASLTVSEQERVIGRTKSDSVELAPADMPADSHVSRNVVQENGRELAIYRRNTAYGGPTDHGTYFVGFSAELRVLQVMLERMAGVGGGPRDALTRHTIPLTGAYYVAPSVPALGRFVSDRPS